jgi:hypothetical protein
MTGCQGWLSEEDCWNAAEIARLETLAGLDALAVALMSARWAADRGYTHTTYRLCRSICRMLLIAGAWFYAHGVLEPLVEYVTDTVLSRGVYEGRRHQFWPLGYMAGLRQLVTEFSYAFHARPYDDDKWSQIRLCVIKKSFEFSLRQIVICAPA